MRRGRGILAAMKHLDQALSNLEEDCLACIAEYEDTIELWITYGGS